MLFLLGTILMTEKQVQFIRKFTINKSNDILYFLNSIKKFQ